MWDIVLLLAAAMAALDDGIVIGMGARGLVRLPLDRHVVITGPTRSGKTRLAKKILKRSGLPAVVLDWHGEYSGVRLDARLLKFDVGKFDKKLLAELIGLGLNLNEPSIYFLYRAIKSAKISTLGDVVKALDDFLVATRSEVEMKAAIIRRLEYVADVFEKGKVPIDAVFKTRRVAVIDLSRLRLYEEKVLASLFVLASLYNHLAERGISNKPNALLVVDEAQNILKRGDVVKYLFFESAKYGLRVVLVTNEMPHGDILVHSYVVMTRPHFTYDFKTKRSALIRDNKAEELWII